MIDIHEWRRRIFYFASSHKHAHRNALMSVLWIGKSAMKCALHTSMMLVCSASHVAFKILINGLMTTCTPSAARTISHPIDIETWRWWYKLSEPHRHRLVILNYSVASSESFVLMWPTQDGGDYISTVVWLLSAVTVRPMYVQSL